MSINNRIIAGIITYNPEIKTLQKNLTILENQFNKIIIIDNRSNNIQLIEQSINKNQNIILKKNTVNNGVAKGLNQLFVIANNLDAEWILTLDQDSDCSRYNIKYVMPYLDKKKVGIVCPQIVDKSDIIHLINTNYEGINKLDKCITSGSLINKEAYQKVGGYDEKMFMDLVDFEFCIRIREKGYTIIRVNNCILLHHLGDLKIYRILGRNINVTNHSPERCYDLAKNEVYYYKKHSDVLKKKNMYISLIKKNLKVLFFEKNKFKKIKALITGFNDGDKIKI